LKFEKAARTFSSFKKQKPFFISILVDGLKKACGRELQSLSLSQSAVHPFFGAARLEDKGFARSFVRN